MPDRAADIARRLAVNAEAVCRHYLPNGRREGGYWLVGDVHNTPGRSLYVRLHGSDTGDRAAGKWTDAATLEHGDLLDLIAATCRLDGIGAALDEARRFLGLSRSVPSHRPARSTQSPGSKVFAAEDGPVTAAPGNLASSADGSLPSCIPGASAEAARRLFHRSVPIAGTLASSYLQARGIAVTADLTALRFHPRCWYRPKADAPTGTRAAWPALIAAVTDFGGAVTGVHRTWLDPSGRAKAPLAVPRRAMGHLLGQAVRFGPLSDVMAAGEGIETVLSLRRLLPGLPLAAALSAAHLAAMRFPPILRRLYIVRDNDPAGHGATTALTARAQAAGIEALTLAPALQDFNDDLRQLGAATTAASVRLQLAPEDVIRFWRSPDQDGGATESAASARFG